MPTWLNIFVTISKNAKLRISRCWLAVSSTLAVVSRMAKMPDTFKKFMLKSGVPELTVCSLAVELKRETVVMFKRGL